MPAWREMLRDPNSSGDLRMGGDLPFRFVNGLPRTRSANEEVLSPELRRARGRPDAGAVSALRTPTHRGMLHIERGWGLVVGMLSTRIRTCVKSPPQTWR